MAYVTVLIGYGLGSIPFGLLAGFLCGKDIREHGSGNIGATNVARVCGKTVGIPVLLIDALKGFAPVFWIAPVLAGNDATPVFVLTGIAAILGHNFPVWLRFKGGKGVATSAGVMGALMPAALGVSLAVFFLTVLITRYVSLGSMLASVALVIAHLLLHNDPAGTGLPLTVMAVLLCGMVIVRHRANIGRLMAGTESRFGASKNKADDESADNDSPEGASDGASDNSR